MTEGSPSGVPVVVEILMVGNGCSLVPMMKRSELTVSMKNAIGLYVGIWSRVAKVSLVSSTWLLFSGVVLDSQRASPTRGTSVKLLLNLIGVDDRARRVMSGGRSSQSM